MPYKIKKPLLTNEEMIEVLNLDSDYPLLKKLEQLSKEATEELYILTGHDWSADTEICESAKSACKDFVYLKWYGEEPNLRKRYDLSVLNLQRLIDVNGDFYAWTPIERKTKIDL